VQTNKSFLLNVLQHHEFLEGEVTTGFIADNPALMAPLNERDRAQRLLYYIGESTCNVNGNSKVLFSLKQSHPNVFFLLSIVNGTPKSLGAAGDPPSSVDPIVPELHNEHRDVKQSLKKIFDQQGPEAFAKVGHALAILTLVYVMC
jgi:pyruvate carboxylase